MSYRDDLAAAHARAAAAERRAADLERRLAQVERADALIAAEAPALAVPERYQIERAGDAMTIQWRWWRPARHLPMLGFALVWDACLVAIYSGGDHTWMSLLFPILHLAVGVGMTYGALAGIFNRTTVTVSPAGLAIAHGPLPWAGAGVLARGEVDQIYARRVDVTSKGSTETTWSLHAHLTSGRDRALLRGLDEHAQALYLERELERALGVRDRAVEGEARDRALPAPRSA